MTPNKKTKSELSPKPIQFEQLIKPILPTWLLAWTLGVVTIVSMFGLLMTAGWFVTMAGLSALVLGASVHYGLPSLLIRVFAMARTFGRYGELLVSHSAIFELLKKLRINVFERFALLDKHARTVIGSAIAQHRLVKDIDILDEFVLKVLSPYLIATLAVTIVGAVIGHYFSWIVLVGFWGLIAVSWFMMILAKPIAKQQSDQKQARIVMLTHTLPSLTQLVLWGRWHDKTAEFLAIDRQLGQSYQQANFHKRISLLIIQWLLAVIVLIVLYMGVDLVQKTGAVMYLATVLAVFGFFDVGNGLAQDPLAYGRSIHAKNNLNELLGRTPSPKIPLPAGELEWHLKDLSFRQVTAVFGVADINCVVKSGVPLVIQGVSGGGKSTLLDGLAGELDALTGDSLIQVADKQLPSWAIDWQGELGYLAQKIDIFNQTLKDNLLLGKANASEEELWRVLEWVGLTKWAAQQPLGLDTPLGEYGVGVSGGQARRIALARLLLTPKRVLLLDEPFAGLDTQTRQQLWQILKNHQKDGILVVVSHHDDIVDDGSQRLVIGEPSLV